MIDFHVAAYPEKYELIDPFGQFEVSFAESQQVIEKEKEELS